MTIGKAHPTLGLAPVGQQLSSLTPLVWSYSVSYTLSVRSVLFECPY